MESEGKEKSVQRRILVRFLIYFVLLFSLSLIIVVGFSFITRTTVLREYKMKAMAQLELQSGQIQNHFLSVRSDILFLPRLNEMVRYRTLESEDDRKFIEQEFLEFSRSKRVYDQIRLIDRTGLEQVRINFNFGYPTIVKKENLQDKGNRYYFTESINLEEGGIYISPFDLNKEQGAIELPLKPMIRFGTPLYDRDGEVSGVLIMNYLGDTILKDFHSINSNYPGQFFLLNMDGYWLFSENQEDEWGFMYPDRQNFSLANRDPGIWQKISSSIRTQFVQDEVLITSLILTPFPDLQYYKQDRSWVLMNTVSFEEMGISRHVLISNLSYIILIITFLCAVISFILAKTIIHKNLYREALITSALYDNLTGLPNRKLLNERAQAALESSRRYRRYMALIFIDLDGFKAVNDSLGHEAGDELLKQVGERMIQSVRSADTVARFGGDEFIILLSEVGGTESCELIARKVLDNLSREFTLTSGKVTIGGSLGVVVSDPESTETLETMIQKADAAMYDVKNTGKNNYIIV